MGRTEPSLLPPAAVGDSMRLIVCGGRTYGDHFRVFAELDRIEAHSGIDCLIHGGCRGADLHASSWATRHGKLQECYSADWDRYGLSAGPKRNQRMLEESKPDAVLAFPGGPGTADMVRRAKSAGVTVIEVDA